MRFFQVAAVATLLSAIHSIPAAGATCGNNSSGFNAWKQAFASEAAAQGVGQRGLQALANASYSQATINADRNQRSFSYSLEKFLQVRGANTIVAQGRRSLQSNAGFYSSLERAYGVPAGVLIAIHGMETAFGRGMGNTNVVSSITTVAYDCRRSAFFTPHAVAALIMVDRGMLAPNQLGAKHGEMGHTQFLPGNALRYGVDANNDGRVDLYNMTDALASTANFLRQKGWSAGAGYQQGEPNFRVLNDWNAAGVYQKAIAIMAGQIEG